MAAGTASIGGRVTVAAPFNITGLANGAVNDLYLLNTGGGTSLTHPSTPPANSVLLGEATTAGGVVTSINMGRSSGRQQFVQPQNLVPGGLAVGITSAGHPATLNLSDWNASPGEGVQFTGTLPASAVDHSGDVILAPAALGRNTIQPTADAVEGLSLKRHSSVLTGAPLLQFLTQTGALLASFNPSGGYQYGANPGGLQDCWITGTAANDFALTLSPTAGNGTFQCNNAALSAVLSVADDTGINAVNIQSNTTGCIPLIVQGPFGGGMTVDLARFQASGNIFTGPRAAIEPSIALRFDLLDSGALAVAVSRIESAFLSNTTGATKGRGLLFGVDSAGKREAFRWEADGAAARIGFLGATAIVRPAAYTLTGSATRTFPTDPSSAYTGIASGVGGTPYAQVTDLNTLRTAVSTLIGVVRQMQTDLGAASGFGLLAP